MPVDCVWRSRRRRYEAWQPGDCWFIPRSRVDNYRHTLSYRYLHDVMATRPPIVVIIQSRRPEWLFPFIIDSHPSADRGGHWDVDVDLASLVNGAKPNITVNPSINCAAAYHGWLAAGVLSDDLGD